MERMEKKRSISEISATGAGSQVPVSNASGSFTMTNYNAAGVPYDSTYSTKDVLDAKQPSTLVTPIIVDGTQYTTVETVINALNNKEGGTAGAMVYKGTLGSIPTDNVAKTWYGRNVFDGSYVWKDGDDIYYSNQTLQYKLNKATSTWEEKTWYGHNNNITGNNIWTDGDNIYYSGGTTHYVLNKETSTWSSKSWSGCTSFNGANVWTDGVDYYISKGNSSNQYVLNKSTSTWSAKTWTGLPTVYSLYANDIWTDGSHIYYSSSNGSNQYQYILDAATSTWSEKTWSGLQYPTGRYVWTDGSNIYYSGGSSSQYILNKSTSTWSTKTWDAYDNFNGNDIWTDGEHTYSSNSSNQYEFIKGATITELPEDGSAEIGDTYDVIKSDTYASQVARKGDIFTCLTKTANSNTWKILTEELATTDDIPTLGTAAALDVATSGDASSTQVVKGDDSRLTDSRNAADVYSWAKAATKPSYTASEVGAIDSSLKGANSGVAELDATGKVPSSQLPSYVDDIIEGYLNSTDGKFYEDSSYTTEITGETGKIYVTLDTNKSYRWSGSAFVEISESLALGETSSTAFAGNRGKAIEDVIPSTATTSNKLVTASDIPSVPTAYTSDPAMDGVADAGSSTSWAKGDHVHPSDTTKADQSEIAPEFSTLNNYAIGEVVIYNGEIYRFTSAHTAGAWDSSEVIKITIGEQISAYCTSIIEVPVSGWSSTATAGYYSQTLTTPTYSTTYLPDFSISGSSATTLPTSAQSAAYKCIQHPNGYIEQVDSTHITVYASSKPDTTFYVKMAGYGMGVQIESGGSDIDPYDSTPAMDGIGSAGLSDDYARGDHVHPSDTSKADVNHTHAVVSTSAAGFVPQGTAVSEQTVETKFLREDGTWEVPSYPKNIESPSDSWSTETWTGLTEPIGFHIWTDGDNIYYSYDSSQYVLNKSTSTWSVKTWNGLTRFYGVRIWTDGDNIYYSDYSSQYVLDKATSTWSAKTWTGVTIEDPFQGEYIWTDGDNIYYSYDTHHYVLDKTTSTWSVKTWNGLTEFYGSNIWTDGTDIYYSNGTTQYVLDKATSTWSVKTWTGLTNFNGYYIWTDGIDIYYSYNANQYVLDKATSTWSAKTWNGLTNFTSSYIWTDGDNIHYSQGSTAQYILNPGNIQTINLPTDIHTSGEITDGAGNALSEKFDANSFVLQKFRVTVTSSSWSSSQTSGYYTYALTLPYPINTYKEFGMELTGSADGTDPTAAQSAAYSLVNYFDANDGTGVTSATLRAKTKPTTTFYIMVHGYYMQKNAATSGVALDITTGCELNVRLKKYNNGSSAISYDQIDFDGSTVRNVDFSTEAIYILSSEWTSVTDANGYYLNYISLRGTLSAGYRPKVSLAGMKSIGGGYAPSLDFIPTSAQIAAYNLVDYFGTSDSSSVITQIIAYAKTKPTTDFAICVQGISVT